MLPRALDAIRERGGGEVRWWVTDPHDDDTAAAAAHGLAAERDLLQLRVPLPVDEPVPADRVCARSSRRRTRTRGSR